MQLQSFKPFLMVESPGDIGTQGGGDAGTVPVESSGGGTLLTDSPPDTSTATTAAPAAVTTDDMPEWKKSLPDDIKEAPSLKLIHDVEGLAKGYVNAQKLIGVDKIPVPSKHATPEEWREAFVKMGLPDTEGDYKIEFEGDLKEFNENPDFDKLKEAAYKLNVLPHQFKGMIEAYYDLNKEFETNINNQVKVEADDAVQALNKEWGMASELNFARARKSFKEFATPEEIEFFEKSGFADQPEVLKIFARVGEKLYGEGDFKGEGGVNHLFNPEQAQVEISKLQLDPAYNDRAHPSHEHAKSEMTKLYKMAYPE